VHRSNGERVGQAPRIYDPQAPLGTIVAQGQKQAACVALLAPYITKHYGGNESTTGGSGLEAPLDTITTQDHNAFTAATLIKLRGTSEAHLNASASGMDEPVPTISAGGQHVAAVHAFLVKYYGADVGQHQAADVPLDTLTTKPRFGLVTVTIDGEEYAIVDIGMRMLEPRELYRAQGFSDDYVIDPIGPSGKRLTKTAQIRMVGNSVPPPVLEAVVAAQFADAA
jgi:DNA (cytosine-5)-methyltransferase 1